MKKIILVFVFLYAVCLFAIPSLSASTLDISYEKEANELKELGLLQGTEKGLELERTANRVEATIMLIRLLGKEEEALQQNYIHPFRDVPAWANSYIGYAFHHKFIKGKSSTQFASNDPMTSHQYATLMLRALGYDDTKGDFKWESALEMMQQLYIISKQEKQELNQTLFRRSEMVFLSYKTIHTFMKDGTLLSKHINLDLHIEDDTNVEQVSVIPKVVMLEHSQIPELKIRVISYDSANAILNIDDLSRPLKDTASFTPVKFNLLIDAQRFINLLTNEDRHDETMEQMKKFDKNVKKLDNLQFELGIGSQNIISSTIHLSPTEQGASNPYLSTDPPFETYVVFVFKNKEESIFAYLLVHIPYNSISILEQV